MALSLQRELENALRYPGDRTSFLSILPHIQQPTKIRVFNASVIWWAASYGWWDIVRQLSTDYQWNPTVDYTESTTGNTILHRACGYLGSTTADIDTVKYLTTTLCLDPLKKNIGGFTPLDYNRGATRQYLQQLVDDSKKKGFNNVVDFLKHKKEEKRDAAVTAALSEGGGNLFQYNVFLNGAPGAGKSSLKRVMLGQDPLAEKDQTATDIVENAVRAITVDKINEFKVIGNDELIDMLAKEVNSHHVVQESGTQGTSGTLIPIITNAPLKNNDSASSLSNEVFDFVPVIVPSKTSAILSIKERLDRATGPVKIYDSSWHHVVDSGGQPQFTDILPLVYRSPSLNVVVVRLTESLDDKPRVYYYEEGKNVYSLPDRLRLSNREMIIRMCQIAASRYASGGVVPYVMIVGTHLDKVGKLNEPRVMMEFNQGLAKIRKEYGNVLICKSEDEIIFPINTMAEGEERQEYTKELQKCITSVSKRHVSPVKVPLRWLIYQLDLDKEGGVARIEDCYKSGEDLGMKRIDVKNALEFFSDMALILYFPDDIPELVLTKMDPLIGRLSKLVKSSFIPLKFYPSAGSERLRTKGLFNMNYLTEVLSDIHLSDNLSNEEFVAILQCLKIAIGVGKDEYFLPSALSLEPIGEQPAFEMLSIPLVFSWGKRYLPHGFFFTVAVELLGRDGDYKFGLRTDIAQWRQEIQVREASGKIPGVVKLTNRMKWIQVSYSSSTRHCPVICEEVNIAIQKSISRFQHTGIGQPFMTSLCPLCKTSDHYCLSGNKKEVTCTVDNSKTGPVSQEMSCWFEAPPRFPPTTVDQCVFEDNGKTKTKDPLLPKSPQLADAHTLIECESFFWNNLGRRLNISFNDRKEFETMYRTNSERLEAVLNKWIQSETVAVTWERLLEALKEIELNRVVQNVQKFLKTDKALKTYSSLPDWSSSSDHYCVLSADKKEVTCTVNNSKIGPVSEMSCFDDQKSSDQSSVSIPSLVDDGKLSAKDLVHVLRSVATVSADWHDLGLALGLMNYQLECVGREGHDEKCKLRKMLSLWLDTGTASWKNLVQALLDPLVNKGDIAQRICEQHPLRQ